MILAIHHLADLMLNVEMEFAHVCLNIKAILTKDADQNVS